MCIANGACGAGRPRPEGAKETVIFEENFEGGNLAGWDVQGGKAEAIREGGNHICRIVSAQTKRRGPEDESIRWDDTSEGAFIFADLPAEKLHDKRVYIHCRYKLLDPARDNDWVGLTIVHIDAKTGEKSWRGGPILESKDPNVWTEARLMADMGENVGDTRLRVGFGRASGTLLIDNIRLTVTPKTFPDRMDEAIADNSDDAFGTVGQWNASTRVPRYWGGDYLWSPRGDGSAKATWVLAAPAPGRWSVDARWTSGPQGAEDRATNAPFTVKYPGGQEQVRVNMADEALAGRFNPLAAVDLKKGQKVEVTLSNDADNSVVADAVRLVRLPDRCAASKLLYENRFSGSEAERKAEAARDWVMEGGGVAEWKEGFLRMIPKRFTKRRSRVETDHFVYWLKRDFPAAFAIEWDFRVPDLGGLAIIFICAEGINGEDIFDPKLQKREGVFGRYFAGDINCYHISYYAGGRGRANVRRNPGFYLVMAGDDLVVSGGAEKWHRLRLTRFGGMLELSVNGKRCLTWFDDGKSYGPVHGGGKIGLRQQNDLRWGDYTNLRVYDLKKK